MRLEVSRIQLLDTLKVNREKHKAIYDEAVEGYRTKALEELESFVAQLRDSRKPVQVYWRLNPPRNQLSDYDRVIGLLEMSQDDTVPLSDAEYGSYVLDQWQWMQNFLFSNKMYSSTAAMMAEESGDDDDVPF